MKKNLILLAAAFTGLISNQIAASAQEDDQSTEFGTRYSVEIDKKITKGLHVHAEEEIRMDETFSIDKMYTGAGISYKINDYLKIAADYNAINTHKAKETGNVWEWKHRVTADVIGTYKTGLWKFSLRERFQATCKAVEGNPYQEPRTALALKSRVKASYLFPSTHLEPFIAFEHRLSLNGAKWDEYSITEDRFRNSRYIGNEDVFTSRLRGQLGAKWSIDRQNSVEIYGLFDRVTEKNIDSKRAKAVLKEPISISDSNRIAIGIGYSFSF